VSFRSGGSVFIQNDGNGHQSGAAINRDKNYLAWRNKNYKKNFFLPRKFAIILSSSRQPNTWKMVWYLLQGVIHFLNILWRGRKYHQRNLGQWPSEMEFGTGPRRCASSCYTIHPASGRASEGSAHHRLEREGRFLIKLCPLSRIWINPH
jgi:hypothetical protein